MVRMVMAQSWVWAREPACQACMTLLAVVWWVRMRRRLGGCCEPNAATPAARWGGRGEEGLWAIPGWDGRMRVWLLERKSVWLPVCAPICVWVGSVECQGPGGGWAQSGELRVWVVWRWRWRIGVRVGRVMLWRWRG